MATAKQNAILARKQCIAMAQKLLKVPLAFAEPVQGAQIPEVNYYTFTVLTILSTREVGVVTLSSKMSQTVIPVLWNYLDAACSLTVGLSQLLDADNYRQKQMLAKGLLNMLSGISLFVLSYNPALVAALGITGAPAAFAGPAFALATLIDAIVATIDYCNALKEHSFSGWMDEKQQEYAFLDKKIKELNTEIATLGTDENDERLTDAIKANNIEIDALMLRKIKLADNIYVRAKVHYYELTDDHKKFLSASPDLPFNLKSAPELIDDDFERESAIQIQADIDLVKARNTMLVKYASFIGMSLLAVATFALFVTCPEAVLLAGLAVTIVVAAVYLYRHKEAVSERVHTFFKSKNALNEQKNHDVNENEIDRFDTKENWDLGNNN